MAAYTPSNDIPSYADHRASGSFDPNVPPKPPPKPRSEDVSRQSTPVLSQFPHQPSPLGAKPSPPTPERPIYAEQVGPQGAPQAIPDPGPNWLPKILEDKSIQDLEEILRNPELLSATCHSRDTAHPSTSASDESLQAALRENIAVASHLNDVEARLSHLQASTQAQLLSAHALERQWRQKQSDMDRALSPFSPSSLYQRLGAGVQDQEGVCQALEESFLEGDGAVATEREITEWVRRYRDAKRLYYSRRERKERWDEGRVGGWR
ncbi:hypothetical protein VF21_02748 [Pseudogymnoascus sp. 05NY08]|nr:hypothetical protein VF21_02748 [Pseudogymnoascus sp. 05NY08]